MRIYKHTLQYTSPQISCPESEAFDTSDGDDPVPHELVEMSVENHLQGFPLQYLISNPSKEPTMRLVVAGCCNFLRACEAYCINFKTVRKCLLCLKFHL